MRLRDVFIEAGKPFPYYPKIAKVFGSVTAAVYFCALVWKDWDREPEADGDVFVKTQKQICEETGLTFEEAKTAKSYLVKIGIIESYYDRLNHNSHLRVDWDKADKIYEAWGESHHARNEQKSDIMGRIPPSGRGESHRRDGANPTVDHCIEKKEENKRELIQDLSPPPGEGYLPFKYFVRVYPKHRFKNAKSIRAADHLWGKITPSDQRCILAALESLSVSPDWLKDHGKWVPNPDRFLENRETWMAQVKTNHKNEVEEIHRMFLEASSQPSTLNKLTPELREHLSHRYDEVLEMTRGQATKPMQLIRDSIEACLKSHEKKNIVTSMEHIFGSTANLERWAKKAGYAS